jgi:sugar O-acyltransferase (sialic acid O-acetyltransferase NeuD family)
MHLLFSRPAVPTFSDIGARHGCSSKVDAGDERSRGAEVTNVIIVGASGFGRELLQYLRDTMKVRPDLSVRGFLDDDASKLAPERERSGSDVLGSTRGYRIQTDDRFLIAVGDPAVRQIIFRRLEERGAQFLTLIHPRSYVAETARIEPGCIIAPFATVGSFARLGQNTLLNLYATAGHDAEIGSHCVFSPYSIANGGSFVGDRVFLGMSAVTAPGVRIGSDSKIAAGSIAYRDAAERSLVSGNPAKSYPLGGAASHPGQLTG